MMRWQVVGTRPEEFARPAELSGMWERGLTLDAPAPVGTLVTAGDLDDHDWWHATVVDVDVPTAVEFSGLTFPATVFVDGTEVAQCESMFLPVRIELEPGRHDVCVRFGSLTNWLRTRRPRGRWRSSLVGAASLRWARTSLLGRAPIYGDLPAPVGFWRPVRVRPLGAPSIVMVRTDPLSGIVEVGGSVDCETPVYVYAPSGELVAEGTTSTTSGSGFVVSLSVPDPQLWWPRGYGPQHLYRLVVGAGDRMVQRHFGFRSVTTAGDDGGFQLVVNGVPIFCRGVTWSPPDPVRLAVDERVMARQVATFADAGATMLRVVGGLVYEQDEFWDQCARQGLLVWQDAMLATFDPPEEMSSLIGRELAELLCSVSGNPALAVVSGGSETLQRPEMLGIERGAYRMPVLDSVLPGVVRDHSSVPYVRSSPSPPADADHLAIRPDTGIAHWFGVGGYLRPVSDVRTAGVRFAAECLAFANPPCPATVDRYFGSAAAAGHLPAWKSGVPRDRGASWDFEDVRDFYVRAVFGEDPFGVRRVDPERYLQLGRLAIAHAMAECFAFWRRADSECSGALVLAGKDLRPGAGWGLVDVDGEPKVALEVLRRLWAPVSVTLSDAGLAGVRIDIHNDTAEHLVGEIVLTATNVSGHRTVEAGCDVAVAGHSSTSLFDWDVSGAFRDLSNSFRFGAPTADGIQAVFSVAGRPHPLRDALIVNPRPAQVNSGLRARAFQLGDEWELEVVSDVALRYVGIEASGWSCSDNYFHLLGAVPYRVRLTRLGTRDVPDGTVGSIDSLRSARIEVVA